MAFLIKKAAVSAAGAYVARADLAGNRVTRLGVRGQIDRGAIHRRTGFDRHAVVVVLLFASFGLLALPLLTLVCRFVPERFVRIATFDESSPQKTKGLQGCVVPEYL